MMLRCRTKKLHKDDLEDNCLLAVEEKLRLYAGATTERRSEWVH